VPKPAIEDGAALDAETLPDLFISHASEDKDSFVRPLAGRLVESGFKVWYDEFDLRIGDSLSESIDYGLASATAGLVVISKAFMAKPWPRRELRGLTARQLDHSSRLMPLWHGVELEDVIQFSPPLADIKALRSTVGLEAIVSEIARAMPSSGPRLDRTVEEARAALSRGDHHLAVHFAFVAFDRRMIRLVNQLRAESLLPSDYRISRYPGAAWEAMKRLESTGRLVMPPGVDVEFLRYETERATSPAATMPPTKQEAESVVAQVSLILRSNELA